MIQLSLWLWFVGKYNKWDKVDPAELFSQAPTEKKEANPKLNMVKFLQVCGRARAWAPEKPLLWALCTAGGLQSPLFDELEAFAGSPGWASQPFLAGPRGTFQTVLTTIHWPTWAAGSLSPGEQKFCFLNCLLVVAVFLILNAHTLWKILKSRRKKKYIITLPKTTTINI